jgi:hypothetical protein
MNVKQVTERKLTGETKKTWRKSTPNRCLPQIMPDSSWERRQEAAKPATNCLKYGRRQNASEYMRLVHDTHLHAY